MCLIGFATGASARFPLVLAANRDEFQDRPAAPARFWPDRPEILAGRDGIAGGTWLGVGLRGRVAAVTNFREGRRPEPGQRSRGELVAGFLDGDLDAAAFARRVHRDGDAYAGFSLVLADPAGCWFVSNRDGKPLPVAPGVHGLSNHLLDTPWPKVTRIREALHVALAGGAPDTAALFHVLGDTARPPDHALPDTGVGAELERQLSPPFVTGDTYGTRCATVVCIDAEGRVHFRERSFGPAGRPGIERGYRCRLGRPWRTA